VSAHHTLTPYSPQHSQLDPLPISQDLEVGDNILHTGPTTGAVELTVSELRLHLESVPEVKKGDSFSLPVSDKIRRNDKLFKIVRSEERRVGKQCRSR